MPEISQFDEKLVHTSASIRITGDRQEIDLVVNTLAQAGFFYRSNKTLYPYRDNPKRFNLYLNFVKCPALFEVHISLAANCSDVSQENKMAKNRDT